MTYIDLILERNDNKQKHLLNHYYFNFQAFNCFFIPSGFFIFVFYIQFSVLFMLGLYF